MSFGVRWNSPGFKASLTQVSALIFFSFYRSWWLESSAKSAQQLLRYQHALETISSLRIPEVKCFVEANQIICSGAHKLLAISRLLRRLFKDGTSDPF